MPRAGFVTAIVKGLVKAKPGTALACGYTRAQAIVQNRPRLVQRLMPGGVAAPRPLSRNGRISWLY
jgi:hypothetical protein